LAKSSKKPMLKRSALGCGGVGGNAGECAGEREDEREEDEAASMSKLKKSSKPWWVGIVSNDMAGRRDDGWCWRWL
jgi:hypothetical protein